MERRYLGLVFSALAMALHALWVGHVLGSIYFMAAFPWGWVAVAAWRGRLQPAWDMGLTMIALLLVSLLVMSLTASGMANLAAVGSLAYFPGLVSWACLLVYILHLRRHENRETSGGWDDMAPAATQFLEGLRRGMGPGQVQNNLPMEPAKRPDMSAPGPSGLVDKAA